MTPDQEIFFLEKKIKKFHESLQDQLDEVQDGLEHTKLGAVYLTTIVAEKSNKRGLAIHVDQEGKFEIFHAIKMMLDKTGLQQDFAKFMMMASIREALDEEDENPMKEGGFSDN